MDGGVWWAISQWVLKESDTTEQIPFHFSLSCIGEGNGTPLQGSCLENPRDTGAWWAAVYGVTQSWTRLKRLGSSSNSSSSSSNSFLLTDSLTHPLNKYYLAFLLEHSGGNVNDE